MATGAREIVGFTLIRDECLKSDFQDKSQLNLLGNLQSGTITACPESNGLAGHYLTQRAVANLLPSLSGNFTLELWYRPQFKVSQDQYVVSLALPNLSRFGSCFSNLESREAGSKISHIVLSFSFSTFMFGSTNMQEMLVQFIVNGVSVDAQRYVSVNSMKPSDWNANAVLHTFPDGLPAGSESALHKLSIYDQALDAGAAMAIFREGMANSKPVISNSTVIVLENGISNDTSRDPAYYAIPVSSTDLPIIVLPVFDLDDSPLSPNYSPNKARAQVYIRQVPLRGELYYLNGSRLPVQPSISVPFNVTTQSYAVRYRPPWDVASSDAVTPLVTLQFAAVDGVTGEVAGWDGVVRIIVKSVVKPPKISEAVTYSVTSRALYSDFNLKGVADDGITTKTIFIASLPQFGTLYQITISSGVKRTLTASQVGFSIDLNSNRIGYLYTGTEVLPESSGNNITADYFSYGVIDDTGRRSLASQVFVRVSCALTVNTKTVWSVRESTSATFSILGVDASDAPRALHYRIDQAPLYGEANTSIDSLRLVYRGQPDFFTVPNRTWHGLPIRGNIPFDYVYLTAHSQDGASSMSTKQLIQVVNVNDPTSINIEGSQSFITHAFGGVTDENSDYSEITFGGFHIIDPDLGVDPVHVEISTSNLGQVTLNRTSLRIYSDYVDFSSLTLCQGQSTWTCSGSAVTSVYMSFVTSPTILEELLNGMTYINIMPDVTDAVTVKISDGEGGSSCIKNSQHKPGSVRSGCFQASLTLEVEVQGYYGKGRTAHSTSSTAAFLNLQRQSKAELDKGDRDIENQLPKKGGDNLSPNVVHVNIVHHTPPLSPSNGHQDSFSLLDSRDVSVSINKRESMRQSSSGWKRAASKKLRHSPSGSHLSRRLHSREQTTNNSSKTKELNEVKVHLYSALPSSTPERQSGSTSSEDSGKKKKKAKKAKTEWTAHTHSSGKTFYYNHKTKKSTWKKPEGLGLSLS
eukprot:gene29733-35899_t